MICTIKNEFLTVKLDSFGAELKSVVSADGTEFLWQGDPAYWEGQAPVLFPYIGRLYGGKYALGEKTFEMKIHGLGQYYEYAVADSCESAVEFLLTDNEDTRAHYPFAFRFFVRYALEGNALKVRYRVENPNEAILPFAVGGHPGFRVPFDGGAFEDYCLEFAAPCRADRVLFTPDCFLAGQDAAYPLEGGTTIPLRHDLFDDDAIILKNTARAVRLCSDVTNKSVTVRFAKMRCIGFWHMPKTDAPYVCIEPWSALPARSGVTEDLYQQSDLEQLLPGEAYENEWDMVIEG